MTDERAIPDGIELTERAMLEDLNAAGEALAAELRQHSCTIGSAYVSALGALPASAIVANRAIGLGLGGAEVTREAIDEIIHLYEQAGVSRYFVHLHPEAQPAGTADWLRARGLEEARGWVKFARGRAAPPAISPGLEVRPATPQDGPAFGRIVADAFDLGEEAIPWLARLIGRPGWHCYMSFAGEEPAGTGVLFVHDGMGWLDFGATAPAFRLRGSQTALMHRRIVDALDLGCSVLATETGEAVPGDPQTSYKNIVRMGFEPLYVRKNFAPPKR
jgi:GNAT superfamily N-acetyltransferase